MKQSTESILRGASCYTVITGYCVSAMPENTGGCLASAPIIDLPCTYGRTGVDASQRSSPVITGSLGSPPMLSSQTL